MEEKTNLVEDMVVEDGKTEVPVDEKTSEDTPNAEVSEAETRAKQLEARIKAMEVEQAKQKTAAAALAAENRNLKRAKMSETERFEAERREMEENAKKYQRLMAGAKAKQVFAGTGLSEEEYSPILELITSEDEVKTESIAQEIRTILESRTKIIEKAVKEKIMRDTPAPPSGGDKSPIDPFIAAFTE